MAKNVFISFRYSDGHTYKEELERLFNKSEDTVDFSEDEDRSGMSEDTIQRYLYGKLRRSSVTIIILTPEAITHRKNYWANRYDDWIYDEIRYSLEDRGNNRTNGIVAVYTPEAKELIMNEITHRCSICNEESKVNNIVPFSNLVYRNMMNVKPNYKRHKCSNVYDGDYDSYCSLISYDEFKSNFAKYIDIAAWKRDHKDQYNICARM